MKRNFENEMWGKTLLSVYRHLSTMANSIDNLIKRIGINSAFNHSVYNSTIKDSNKIIELTERKIKIINLKVIIERALNNLRERDLKILMLCYVDNLNYKKIIDLLKITERTYFRRKEIAIACFSEELNQLGFDATKLNQYLKNENWIKSTYYQTINSSANKFCKSQDHKQQYKLIKMVLSDFNSEPLSSFCYY